mgnify:CR=1 FL=1
MDFHQLTELIQKNNILFQNFNGLIEKKDIPYIHIKQKGFTIIYIPNGDIGHFVCYYFIGGAYFFDSFGHPPSYYKLPNNIDHNTRQIQHPSSCLCGAYIIFIVSYCIQNKINPEKFIKETFDFSNLKKNDSIVYSFIAQLGFKNKKILKCL